MVDFTEPYYYASIITLVKNDGDYADAASVADLKGVTCTSQQNTIWYDSCLPQIEDANILPAQESAPAMLVAPESGKCDAVVTDILPEWQPALRTQTLNSLISPAQTVILKFLMRTSTLSISVQKGIQSSGCPEQRSGQNDRGRLYKDDGRGNFRTAAV